MTDAIFAALDEAQLYRRCFEDSTDAIIITDVHGRIQRANNAWLELHGYELDEVVGKTTRLVRGASSTREMYESMWREIRDPKKGSWTGEVVNRCRDGTEIPLLLTITPVRCEGEVVGYMGVALDMRAKKQAEEMKRLYDLLVLHDLRSPLGSVITALDFVVGGHLGPVEAHHRELLERARCQARRMLEMIGTSLDVEKLKRRKLSVDARDVDVAKVVRDVLDGYQDIARRRQLDVSLVVDGRRDDRDSRVVWELDPIHLQRCIDNLVKNAMEACPQGGQVEASVETFADGLRLRIRNDGPPIPAHVRATLFHPFGTYGKRGTGLGLYGVKLLVEAMGGEVDYESTTEGTVFELRFGRLDEDVGLREARA